MPERPLRIVQSAEFNAAHSGVCSWSYKRIYDTFTHIFLYWTNTERFYGFHCKSGIPLFAWRVIKITLTLLLISKVHSIKDVMQGKLFQKCTHLLYCSVLSLGAIVNTRRVSQPDMESIFTKIIFEIFWSKKTIMWIIKI